MYRVGYEYAAQLHANGRFDRYQLAELLLQVSRSAQWGNEEGCTAGEQEGGWDWQSCCCR